VFTPDGQVVTVNLPDSIPSTYYPAQYEEIAQELADLAITDPGFDGIAAITDFTDQAVLAASAGEFEGAAALDAYAGAADVFAGAEAANATFAATELGGIAGDIGFGAAAAGVETALAAIPVWGWVAAAALALFGGKLLGKGGGPKPPQFAIIQDNGRLRSSQRDYLQGFDDIFLELDADVLASGAWDYAKAAPFTGYQGTAGSLVDTVAVRLQQLEPARVLPFPTEAFQRWAIHANDRWNERYPPFVGPTPEQLSQANALVNEPMQTGY
jgi:hypothetical protein